MSRRIPVWTVCLLAIFWVVGTVGFGMFVHDMENGKRRLGPVTPVVQDLVRMHETLRKAWREFRDPAQALTVSEDRFTTRTGFRYSYPAGTDADAPYLLLNRYDGDDLRSVSELVDLASREIVARWEYDVDPIWKASAFKSRTWDLKRQFRTSRFAGIHALLTRDGKIVVNGMNTPLLAFGPCGKLLWEQDAAAFHHSIETDEQKNIWVPAHVEPKTLPIGGPGFLQDTVTKLSPDGKIVFSKAVVDILAENGLGYLVYGHGFAQDDPVHLNDIEPVRTDGAIWRKGDVFLSLRNRSLVLLYRPATGKILWSRAGDDAWIHQHDVAILDDHTITVFDNRSPLRQEQRLETDGVNRLVRVDVRTGAATPVYPEAFRKLDLRTGQQGRGLLLPDGKVVVEETDFGRVLQFDRNGDEDWSFVNRATNGRVYLLNWSRIVPRELGDAALTAIGAARCGDKQGQQSG